MVSSYHHSKTSRSEDGKVAKGSLVHLLQKQSDITFSDVPLNGYITALCLVSQERTKEALVVCGADDGTVALWKLEYANPRYPVDEVSNN